MKFWELVIYNIDTNFLILILIVDTNIYIFAFISISINSKDETRLTYDAYYSL